MSAAARAEARRKAILSRGTDRLAKLTTSARGEDAPAYLHDDPPLPSLSNNAKVFLGEDMSNMSTPARLTPSPTPSPQPKRRAATPSRNANIFEGLNSSPPDPSVWLPEQQQQFLQALMNASSSPLPQSSPIGDPIPMDSTLPPMDNPFDALLGAQNGAGVGGGMFPPFGPGMSGKASAGNEESQQTKLQKAMPLIHILAMWCLLAYFVLWFEPQAHGAVTGENVRILGTGLWKRWSELGQQNPLLSNAARTFRVQIVPFFWAFTTLQIALHSVRIFSGFNSIQPPMLLALALPHLPQPLPSIIVNALKYMQMGTLFLDDLAGLVVGIGFIIYFSGWFAQSSS
ncbi:hypothetical protein B0H34DRAFT_761211 [Crassisporium funariophilum]|nr:hypothetical protein B0H34DRAFT_761211 [Crassisporium funariophilum]